MKGQYELAQANDSNRRKSPYTTNGCLPGPALGGARRQISRERAEFGT
jgi:hypothetical protein